MPSCVIFSKSWVYALTPKFLWWILDIQGSSSVKFHDNWMCVDSPFVFYKLGVYCWNAQWTTYATPDFVDLILKLGCMFWAIMYYDYSLVCEDQIYEFYELVSLWFGCIMYLMIVSCALGNLCDGNRIFLVLRYRFWDECVSLW